MLFIVKAQLLWHNFFPSYQNKIQMVMCQVCDLLGSTNSFPTQADWTNQNPKPLIRMAEVGHLRLLSDRKAEAHIHIHSLNPT